MKTPSNICKEIYHRHINEGVTLTHIAKELGISTSRVSQLYKKWERYLEIRYWSEDNIRQLNVTNRLQGIVGSQVSSSIYNLANESIENLLKVRYVGMYQAMDIIAKSIAYVKEHSDYYEDNDIEINNSTYNVKNFVNWLKEFEDSDSSYGDLIRDIQRDSNFPKDLRLYTFDDLRTYIKCQGACSECISTLEDAYKVFSKR